MPGEFCVPILIIICTANLTYVTHSRASWAWESRQRMEAHIIECLSKSESEDKDLGGESVLQLAHIVRHHTQGGRTHCYR